MDTVKTRHRRNTRGGSVNCPPTSPLGKVPGPPAESAIRNGIQSFLSSLKPRLQLLEEQEVGEAGRRSKDMRGRAVEGCGFNTTGLTLTVSTDF